MFICFINDIYLLDTNYNSLLSIKEKSMTDKYAKKNIKENTKHKKEIIYNGSVTINEPHNHYNTNFNGNNNFLDYNNSRFHKNIFENESLVYPKIIPTNQIKSSILIKKEIPKNIFIHDEIIIKPPIIIEESALNNFNKNLINKEFGHKNLLENKNLIQVSVLNDENSFKMKKAEIVKDLDTVKKRGIDKKMFLGDEYKNSKMLNEIAYNANFNINITGSNTNKKIKDDLKKNPKKNNITNNKKNKISFNDNSSTNEILNNLKNNQENFSKNKNEINKISSKTFGKNNLDINDFEFEKKNFNNIKNFDHKFIKNENDSEYEKRNYKNIKNYDKIIGKNKNEIEFEKKNYNNIKNFKNKDHRQNIMGIKINQKNEKFKNLNNNYTPKIVLPNENKKKFIKKEKTAIDYFLYKDHSFAISSCDDGYLGAFVKLLNYPEKKCQNKFLKFYLNDKYFSIANEFNTDKYIEIIFLDRIKLPNETYGNCFSISYSGKKNFLDMCFETTEIANDILKSIKFLSFCKNPKKAHNYLMQQEKIRKCFVKYKFHNFVKENINFKKNKQK